MYLENIRPFGNHVPGDLVMVPDGVFFDTLYYKAVEVESNGQTLVKVKDAATIYVGPLTPKSDKE